MRKIQRKGVQNLDVSCVIRIMYDTLKVRQKTTSE